VVLEIGHAVATGVDDLAVLHDRQVATRRRRLVPCLEENIKLRRSVLRLVSVSNGPVDGCQQDQARNTKTGPHAKSHSRIPSLIRLITARGSNTNCTSTANVSSYFRSAFDLTKLCHSDRTSV